MSTESEKVQQVTTEHVVMTLISACRAAVATEIRLQDDHSHYVMMKLEAAIREGEQWLAG